MIKIDKKFLKQGMEVAVDIHDFNGNILISKNTILRDFHLKKINTLAKVRYIYIYLPKVGEKRETDLDLSDEESACDEEKTKIVDCGTVSVEQIREDVYKKINQNLERFFESPSSDFEILFQVIDHIIKKVLSFDDLVYEINRIQCADHYLYNHCINTTILSILTGISMGLKTRQLYSLGKGAFFSDIGKLQIDQRILSKPSKLTDEEYEIVKKYPEYGYSFMKNFPEMDEDALDCILHSRERYDGKGYPHGLKNDEISIFAKIVGLATYFDAISSERPYKAAMSPYKAMSKAFDELNVHFEAELLKKSVKMLGYYDIGMFVELQSSDLAKVIKCGRHKPLLKIFQNQTVNNISHFYEIDMAKNPSVKIKDVLVKTEYDRLVDYI